MNSELISGPPLSIWAEVLRHADTDEIIKYLIDDRVGKKKIIKKIGIDEFLANLSPEERRELKRRLE